MKTYNTIGIVGSGKMGTDIFNFFDEKLFKMRMVCENSSLCEYKQRNFIKKMNRYFKNGLIDEGLLRKKTLEAIFTPDYACLHDCDLVIEAVTEKLEIKKKVFSEIENAVSPSSVIATNTSSISIKEIFAHMDYKNRCIGLHFFYPVKLRNIVEIVTLNETSKQEIVNLKKLFLSLERNFIVLPNEERSLLNRIFLNIQSLGCWFHNYENISYNIIDTIIKDYLFPVGIFEILDSVGLDTVLESVKNYALMNQCELHSMLIREIENLVSQKRMGIKSGAGFYDYRNRDNNVMNSYNNLDFLIEGLRAVYINTVFNCMENGICSEKEIEMAVKEYMSIETGPVELAKQVGYKKVVTDLRTLRKKTGFAVFEPSSLLTEELL